MAELLRRGVTGEYQTADVPKDVSGGYNVNYYPLSSALRSSSQKAPRSTVAWGTSTGTSRPIAPGTDYDRFRKESALDRHRGFGMLGTGMAQNIRWAMSTGERTMTGHESGESITSRGKHLDINAKVDWELGNKQATYDTPEYYRKVYRDTFTPTHFTQYDFNYIGTKKGASYANSLRRAQEHRGHLKTSDFDYADSFSNRKLDPYRGTSQAYRPKSTIARPSTSGPYSYSRAGSGLRENVNKYSLPGQGFGVRAYRSQERLLPLSESRGSGAFRGPIHSIRSGGYRGYSGSGAFTSRSYRNTASYSRSSGYSTSSRWY